MERYWTADRVLDGLIELYRKGVPLTAIGISDSYSGLYSALYTKYAGKTLFPSLSDARVCVAKRFEEAGDMEAAQKVLALNGPQKAHNKFSEQDWAKRRDELLDELKSRIESGEDLSLRYQQKIGRFASLCERAFGTYRAAFAAAAEKFNDPETFNYASSARHIKHDKNYYLNRLVGIAREGKLSLDPTALGKKERLLVARLHCLYKGYYNSLEAAREILEKSGESEAASRADSHYWNKLAKTRRRKRGEARRNDARERIFVLEPEKQYDPTALEVEGFDKLLYGKDIVRCIRNSKHWVNSNRAADILDCTRENVVKNLFMFDPTGVVRYLDGQRTRYFYQRSVLKKYKRKIHVHSPEDSLHSLAKHFDIGYSKLRNISDNLGLGTFKGRYRVLSKDEIKLVRAVLKREQNTLKEIISKLSPDREYSFSELEMMGVPISHFDVAIRNGKLPRTSGIRKVRGDVAIDYFKNQYETSHLSQGLRLITYFRPHLYTTTDIVQKAEMTRATVLYKLENLLEESPDSCFSIRGAHKRRVLVTGEALPFIINWEERGSLQLISALNRIPQHIQHGKEKIIEEMSGLENLIVGDKIPKNKTDEAFRVFDVLRSFQKREIKLGETSVTQQDLFLIYSYMKKHKYPALEFSEPIPLEKLAEMVHDEPLTRQVLTAKQRLGFAIYQSNEPLIRAVMNSMGVNHEYFFQMGQEALMSSIENFDPTRAKLSTYAWTAIKRRIERVEKLKEREIALHPEEYKEWSPLSYLEDKTPQPNQQMVDAGLKNLIDEVTSSLDSRERMIILQHFGIGVKRKNLNEIGDELNLTRERIRQIERDVLEKLSKHPKAKELTAYLT